MKAARLALALVALAASTASAEEPFGFELSKGGKYLFAINGVLGATLGSVSVLSTLTGGPTRDVALGAAQAVGLLTVFLGGGLTAGHLLEPTPPMAWSSFFAGIAGAGLGLGIMTTFSTGAPFEAVLLGSTVGYVLGAGLDLALPGQATMSWIEFWVPVVFAVIPGGALFFGMATMSGPPRELVALVMMYPVASFLITRGILGFIQPFQPWVDDLKPPFRAAPIIGFTPSGAMVGIAANW
jgi:hypothetical protein